ncbi:hypothetical protein K8R32_03675 [bacterium]|nr:hypothetical protein [bacterium]
MASKRKQVMLGKLFGSNTRVRILKLFLIHPEQSFYIRQISRELKLQLNSVRRELENLEKFGLLKSGVNPDKEAREEDLFIDSIRTVRELKKQKTKALEKQLKTDKKYFRVNVNFVLYEEIKALIVKAQVLYERDFVDKLELAGNPKLLVLTGFFVNDEQSQVDLLVVGRFNKRKLLKLIKSLEDELGREINFTLMNVQEFKYRRDITDVFLYDILERKNIVVIDEFGLS